MPGDSIEKVGAALPSLTAYTSTCAAFASSKSVDFAYAGAHCVETCWRFKRTGQAHTLRRGSTERSAAQPAGLC